MVRLHLWCFQLPAVREENAQRFTRVGTNDIWKERLSVDLSNWIQTKVSLGFTNQLCFL